MVISRSYYLSSGEHFLLGALSSSLSLLFQYSLYSHTSIVRNLQSRSDLLVYLGGAYRESLGESTGTPFYFLCLSLYVEGTSLTTSLSYQDTVLAVSYIYS